MLQVLFIQMTTINSYLKNDREKKIVHIKNITPTSVDTENENCVLLGNYVGSSGNYVASSGNSIYIAAEV